MGTKMIGFLGGDKYDILLYLSKILNRLNKKVLLVDYSENRALTYSIPSVLLEQPIYTVYKNSNKAYEEAVRNTESISYQEIDFLFEPKYEELEALEEQYDVILIDFGYQVFSKFLSRCEEIFLCLDPKLHHIIQLKPLAKISTDFKDHIHLIFRQVYDCKINVSFVCEELGMEFPKDHIYTYYEETLDMKYCIDSQYNHVYHFMKISKGLKECLMYLIRTMYPDLSYRDLKSAYRIARTGRRKVTIS